MELGNALFGNSRGEAEVPDSWAGGLLRLINAVARLKGEQGDGYGRDFSNDTFELMPYYWGDCECGFEKACFEWEADNTHTSKCFHTRYQEEEAKLNHLSYDERSLRMLKWSKANGFEHAPNGMASHCDCGHREDYLEFIKDKQHADDCKIIRPNFLYKPTGFQICWYKYVGRDSYMTPGIDEEDFWKIIDKCIASLELKEPKKEVVLPVEVAERLLKMLGGFYNAAFCSSFRVGEPTKEEADKVYEEFYEFVKKARRGD